MTYHCFFEQSGTFKNEFKKLGYEAYDYDMLNVFDETDYQIDLFKEIENAFVKKHSIFDDISSKESTILAFFPCIRFENQCYMMFQGTQKQLKDKSIKFKLEYDLKLHEELHQMYSVITKLALVCIDKNIPLIIENPYTSEHYLTRYWALKPQLIDRDRILKGDNYSKPTQYWFVNCEPKCNILFEPMVINERKMVNNIGNSVERSLITPQYASRFIREFII